MTSFWVRYSRDRLAWFGTRLGGTFSFTVFGVTLPDARNRTTVLGNVENPVERVERD